ncbi:Uncharacterised protein [Mycobacteroides abscessus subsp. abscessus]|nr:Uncharacterised protein [Mycobacteroides abscessus subsp. abscessus]
MWLPDKAEGLAYAVIFDVVEDLGDFKHLAHIRLNRFDISEVL